MLEDLEKCKEQELPNNIEIECCFVICFRYWIWMQKTIAAHRFFTRREEIHFFKVIKPLYTAFLRYFALLYHAHIFEPSCGIDVRRQFLQKESLRLEKFIKENEAFYTYYKNNETHLDEMYFLRKPTGLSGWDNEKPGDIRKMTTTSHDHLVATILSLEWYTRYIQEKLDAVG
jgi:hypothetical protein